MGFKCFKKEVHMGTNCTPLLADVFLYSYGGRLLKKNEKEPSRSFNLTFRYINNVLKLDDYVDHIYAIELTRK
jgi:hypothetical protein